MHALVGIWCVRIHGISRSTFKILGRRAGYSAVLIAKFTIPFLWLNPMY